MSSIGVPSSISTPRTCRFAPSRPSNSTTVSPMGFGRRGDRVANTPWGRSSVGGQPTSSYPSTRSNIQITKRWENPSTSRSPRSNSGEIFSTPSAECLAPSPRGTSDVCSYGLHTNPIGRNAKVCTVPRFLVRPERFELPTLWFEAKCSIQLSYGRTLPFYNPAFATEG